MEGWICPRCRRVYSPFTAKCEYCGPEITTGTSTVQVPQAWGGESCPGCGGPRWAGPQSGCPQGWHYGACG